LARHLFQGGAHRYQCGGLKIGGYTFQVMGQKPQRSGVILLSRPTQFLNFLGGLLNEGLKHFDEKVGFVAKTRQDAFQVLGMSQRERLIGRGWRFGAQRIEGKRVSRANSVIVAFTCILAFGLILSYFVPGQVSTVMGLLFGSMLGVDSFDIMLTSVATLLLVVFFVRHYWEILSTTFDEEYSSVVGMPVKMLKIVISVLLAFYITVTIRAVGTLMMEALLVIPGAVALQLTDSYHTSWKMSMVLIAISGVASLILAFYWNLPVSPLMVVILSLSFLVARFVFPQK